MVGVSVANKREWEATLNYYNKAKEECVSYPYGEYFVIDLFGEKIVFYRCGVRKTNSVGANQYMIDRFKLDKVIVVGTCAGVDKKYNALDIVLPSKAVQYDCTVKEIEPLIRESFTVKLENDCENNSCVIGTADKAVVMWKDYIELRDNNITVADTEAAAIAYVCKVNNVRCVIVKGISDFPIEEIENNTNEAFDNQYETFIKNIPIIMNEIYSNYLGKLIK